LDPYFPGAVQAANSANRLVMLLPSGARWFAVCFGYGASALEYDAIEANFGLRVAARLFRPTSVSELRSRRIDATARTQSVQTAAAGDLRDLDVALEGEFIRKLVGRLEDGGMQGAPNGAIIASDSISFAAAVDLSAVQETLGGLLERLSTTDAQEEFLFVDALSPLRTKDRTSRELDALLAATILNRAKPPNVVLPAETSVKILDFAAPDEVSLEEAAQVQVTNGDRKTFLESYSMEGIRTALREVGVRRGSSFLRGVRLLALGDDGEEVSQNLPLRSWLVFEAGDAASRFILTLGRWFRLNESYTQRLNTDLARLRDFTNTLKLPDWPEADDESAFNLAAARRDAELLLMDRRLQATEDGDRLEVCDLFHTGGNLVHVKRFSGSQTLSHLFSQGSVSASLLAADGTFQRNFQTDVSSRSSAHVPASLSVPRIVTFAVGLTDPSRLPLGLPTFSKVNLRDHAQRVRRTKAVPGLAAIKIVP
jgi:uncharacterized protein (TIGR04141 family)